MLILEIAIGLVLGAIILANLDSILGVVLFVAVIAIAIALTAGAASWLWEHPSDAGLLALIIFAFVACVYWSDWIQWRRDRALSYGKSISIWKTKIQIHGVRRTFFPNESERKKDKRQELGYDE